MTKLHSNQLKPEVHYFRRYFLSKLHDFGCITSPFDIWKKSLHPADIEHQGIFEPQIGWRTSRVWYKGLGSKRSRRKILNTLIAPFVFRVVNIFYLLAGICQYIHFRCGLTLSKCPFSSFTQRSRRIKNSARFQGFTLGKWEGPRGSSKLDYYPPGHKDFPRCQSAQV